MGRPRMNRGLPPYASEFRDRHGKVRIRFRKKGLPAAYAAFSPATDDFYKQYNAWLNGDPVPAGYQRGEAGTFNDLIAQYYRSTVWRSIPKESTRVVYRGELERFRAKYGARRVETMSAKNLTKLMEKMADTPSAANNLLKRLRQLFDYAIILEMRDDNPAKAVRSLRSNSTGFHEWTEEEIAQYEKHHVLGTKARLALEIFLCTAQRRSDAAVLREDPDRPGRVKVRQLKTDRLLSIRIHRDLKAAIDACPSGAPTFLVSQRGKPFTKESLGNWFKKRCKEAGLPHCSAHGLRKAASRRMAELGLSNQIIKSITGHTTDSEVARYTSNADQALLADRAMDAMEADSLSNPSEKLDKSELQDADL